MHLVCALVVKGQSILSRMMNLVLLCSELKFLELWLNQNGFALVVRALAIKGQSIQFEDMNFEIRQRCGTCPPSKQNKTRFTCQRRGALACIDHFQVFCNTCTPGILTSGDFYPGRSGGHVVPRWKSPDIMVSVSSVFLKVCWGTKTLSQILPTVSQNIVTWDHINGERSFKFLQVVS